MFRLAANIVSTGVVIVSLVCLTSEILGSDSSDDIKSPLSIGVVEDHPWIVKNSTCLAEYGNTTEAETCYVGFLIDFIKTAKHEYSFNYTLHEFEGRSLLDKKTSKWTGVMAALVEKKVDMALAPLNITEDGKKFVTFSAPFINDSNKNKTYALAFDKDLTTLESSITHLIKKLINQRYIEQLIEKWFNDERDSWDINKQISAY